MHPVNRRDTPSNRRQRLLYSKEVQPETHVQFSSGCRMSLGFGATAIAGFTIQPAESWLVSPIVLITLSRCYCVSAQPANYGIAVHFDTTYSVAASFHDDFSNFSSYSKLLWFPCCLNAPNQPIFQCSPLFFRSQGIKRGHGTRRKHRTRYKR